MCAAHCLLLVLGCVLRFCLSCVVCRLPFVVCYLSVCCLLFVGVLRVERSLLFVACL